MKTTSTQEYLINYLYGQLDEIEMEAIGEALSKDSSLGKEYEALKETMLALANDEALLPSETSINIIMDYSKKTRIEKVVEAF